MKWTISRQILVGYAISLIFILIIGYSAHHVSKKMLNSFAERGQAGTITRRADEVLSLLQDAETGQRGFVLTGADRYLQPYNQSERLLNDAVANLEKSVQDSGLDGAAVTELRAKVAEKMAELERTVELRRTSGFEASVQIINSDEGRLAMDRIRQLLGDLKQKAMAEYETSNNAAAAAANVFEVVLELGLSATVVAMLIIGIVTVRSISRPVNEIANAARDISSGNLDVALSRRASAEELRSLAKSFTSMVAALKQSAATSKRIAAGDLAVEVHAQSEADVVGQAQAGMVSKLSELIEQVQHSGLQVNSSAVEIAATGKQQQSTASEMASTTTEISSTAKEMSATSTELLKAADNVNMVSQQLAGLASNGKDGLGRLERIMRQMGMDKFSEEVRRSAREVEDVSRQIDQMIERVQSIAPSMESVYEGMQAQTQGAGQISDALAQLGEAARQTADSIRDSNRAVEQLNDASRGLQTAISRFKLR